MQEVRGMFTRIPGKYIKTSDAIEIFETGNHCKSSHVFTGMTTLERAQEPLSPRRTQITEDPKKDGITEDTKKDSITEDLSRSTMRKDPITKDPKQDPINEDPT